MSRMIYYSLTSGEKNVLIPEPAPSNVTPRKKKMSKMTYGKVALKYTTYEITSEKNITLFLWALVNETSISNYRSFCVRTIGERSVKKKRNADIFIKKTDITSSDAMQINFLCLIMAIYWYIRGWKGNLCEDIIHFILKSPKQWQTIFVIRTLSYGNTLTEAIKLTVRWTYIN